MSNNALETQGVQIKRGDGGSPAETFALIPDIQSFDGPGGSPSIIDTTSLDDTARTKKPGLQDEGQFSFEMLYQPADAQHAGLRADKAARTLRNFEVELTDTAPTVIQFAGFVTEFTISGGVDDVLKANVTIEISGAVTIS